ncbi:MAG TPA: glycosyltransferase family A protein [Sphingomonas sp.]|nr:glycosyltransferase family A protein [Sphingomonas sp.]
MSVVIPLFNKVPHVVEAVKSALNQSLPPRQVIVVDDGSTDGSLDAVRTLDDPRIVIATRSPPGPGGYAARNLGIELASSEWIAFLDADDVWHDYHLADLAEAVRNAGGNAACAFSRFQVRQPGRDRLYPVAEDHLGGGSGGGRLLGLEDILKAWLATGMCPLWTGATAFRRQVLIDVGMFPAGRARRGGDKDAWLRAVAAGSCVYAPRPSAEFRLDAVNRVSNTTAHLSPPIILETIAAMLPNASPGEQRLLRRLANQELTQYARYAAGAGSRVDWQFVKRLYLPEGAGAFGRIVAYGFASLTRRGKRR